MSLSQIVGDVRAHLEQGAQLLNEHLPALAEHAAQIENDPLVQAAQSVVLPPGVRQLAADLITRLAAEFPVPPPGPEQVPEQPPA